MYLFFTYVLSSYVCTYYMLKHWDIAELCANKDELVASLVLSPITCPLFAILTARNNFPVTIRNPFDYLVDDIIAYRDNSPRASLRKSERPAKPAGSNGCK